MLAVAAQRQARGVDGLDGAHGVALDARNLHLPAHGVAGHAQVVLHADLGGVFHLCGRAAQHGSQRACGHGAGHAHLALAAYFGARERGVDLVDDADGTCGEQKVLNARLVGTRHEPHVVVQNGRYHARRAVGGRRHHAAPSGVFLVHGHGVEVYPVEHGERVAQGGLGVAAQAALQFGGAAADVQRARQGAFARAAAPHGAGHGLPDGEQLPLQVFGAAPLRFVGMHQLRNAQAAGLALRQQLGAAGEGVGRCSVSLVGGRAVEHALARSVHHKAATHREVFSGEEVRALCIQRGKAHAVGVARQAFTAVQQVLFFDKAHRVRAQQLQQLAGANGFHRGRDLVRVDAVGLVPGQAQQHGAVGAVANTRGGQRAEQLDAHAVGAFQRAGLLQAAGELARGNHGPHGVGAGWPDADLEEVENAEGHGVWGARGPGAGREWGQQKGTPWGAVEWWL